MRPRIALATSAAWPALSPDDGDLIAELAREGCDAAPVVWSDPAIEWREFDQIVIRSCWDYHLRPDEFRSWLGVGGDRIANHPDVVRWNMHKSYLLDLEKRGLRIPPTTIVNGPAVAKPAISASAWETHLFKGDLIVQGFVPEIATNGEWSLIFFSGAFSHAVRKLPKSGDFRVQQELGGSAVAATPPPAMIEVAERALEPLDVLYARVDVVETRSGILLMELELIEPSLFLKAADGAARRFANAISLRARALRA